MLVPPLGGAVDLQLCAPARRRGVAVFAKVVRFDPFAQSAVRPTLRHDAYSTTSVPRITGWNVQMYVKRPFFFATNR
jgi:hypothetical protein